MEKKIITLITVNFNSWKQRKYRREAALVLKQLRQDGWRFLSMQCLPACGVDISRFTVYSLQRLVSGGD